MPSPFATRLLCLVCGSHWWSETDRPKKCPTCRPARDETTDPPTSSIHVAMVLAPDDMKLG